MKAVIINSFGGPEQLELGDRPTPEPGPYDVLVKVAATALNRADILQRRGHYPPPPGESPILGLEMAGEVVRVGKQVRRWQPGERVCGLLGGGGYAEYAILHQDMALPIPKGMELSEAAAIPEVFLTAFQTLRWLADLQPGEWLLLHAAASGVGTAAIQLARMMGAGRIIGTASAPKHALCRQLGADYLIDYRERDFLEATEEYGAGHGVDVVIDFIAAPYFQRNLDVLRADGRLVLLALMGGVRPGEVNLAPLLRKRLQIVGSTLRARSPEYKIRLTQALYEFAWPAFREGRIHPVIDTVLDWTEVAEAHRMMEANANKGKIVLKVG